ncbi:MAG: aminomethyltransferase beta-barrel domain-containing protein [Polyangiales bacterium]
MKQALRADRVHWIHGEPESSFDADVQIRYRHGGAQARITPAHDGFVAEFGDAQRAITPGQAAVVYRGDEVLGGGFIAT